MSNLFECCYCNKSFTNKYNMLKHQKTTKKCINLQKILNNEITDEYLCKYCNYNTLRKENIDRHTLSCFEKHKEVIEKYEIKICEKDKELIEKEKLNLELKNTIEKQNVKIELAILKAKFDSQISTNSDLQKMVMNSRQNNTYVTNQQRIEYSKANLQPYDELKDNISTIIDSKFNKNTFQTIEKVATFITNDILNYNNKEYYHCFDAKGSIFHKKNNNDEIDIDEKAENLLNDILPSIIERSRNIYMQESDEYNDKNTEDKDEEKDLLNLSKALKTVRNISKKGSEERNLCIIKIAQCYCVSSTQVKLCKN
jgi:hypothetical protein